MVSDNIVKKKIKIFFVLYLFLSSSLWGIDIEFTNLIQELIPTPIASSQKSYYKLTAQSHIEKFSKTESALLLLNRKKYMLKNNYHLNGKFTTSNTELKYKKAYLLSGKVYLLDVKGYINSKKITAKEVVFDGYKKYLLKKCEVRTAHRIYRRSKFTIKEQ
jgi:hypothetical protein